MTAGANPLSPSPGDVLGCGRPPLAPGECCSSGDSDAPGSSEPSGEALGVGERPGPGEVAGSGGRYSWISSTMRSARASRALSRPASNALFPATAPPTPTMATTSAVAPRMKMEIWRRVRVRRASIPSPLNSSPRGMTTSLSVRRPSDSPRHEPSSRDCQTRPLQISCADSAHTGQRHWSRHRAQPPTPRRGTAAE